MSQKPSRRGRPPVEEQRRERLALLGGIIRQERRSRNLTQRDLARAIGYAGASTICKIEKGTHAALDVRIVRAILEQLGIAPALLGSFDLDEWPAS